MRQSILKIVFTISVLFLSVGVQAQIQSFSGIAKAEKDKVVHIATKNKVKRNKQLDPFLEKFFPNVPRNRQENALGSGFFISADGFIATNNHVVENADEIEVLTTDGKSYKAEMIGTDPRSDLALIKIEGKRHPFVKFGDSSKMEIGDWVVAIGNPLGLDFSVTAGILSATGRSIFPDTAYGQFLQTDAAINPGNSGGPLFNIDGEVIGINTAILASSQGLGFAIPSNLAQVIINQLKEKGKVERGWLGVSIQTLERDLTEGLGVDEDTKGVIISGVSPDSPGDKSGLKENDIIVKFGDKVVTDSGELQRAVGETEPDKTVVAEIIRDGKKISRNVQVGIYPDNPETVVGNKILGMSLRYLGKNEAEAGEFPYTGLGVVEVEPGSVADEEGIKPGDLIRQVNRQVIKSVNDFRKIVNENKGSKIVLMIYRNGSSFFRPIPVK